jgi:hypothetical protein
MTFIRLLWAMGVVSSFFWDRSMVVKVDGLKSAPRYLSSGVHPIYAVFFLFLYSFFKVSFLC